MAYKIIIPYITESAYLWIVEGRIPVLKKRWLLPQDENVLQSTDLQILPLVGKRGKILCFLTHHIHTCSQASVENHSAVLIHLQHSSSLCTSVHLNLTPQNSSQRVGHSHLHFMVNMLTCSTQLCVFLVLLFVSSSPVCLGKCLPNEIKY